MRCAARHSRQIGRIEPLEPRQLLSATLTTLASFAYFGRAQGGVVVDANGDLFGTTQGSTTTLGTLYELPAGSDQIKTLATFTGGIGADPGPGLIIDDAGNIFGVCANGGAFGHGAVFELPAGKTTVTTLASYNGADGDSLGTGVVRDAAGNIYVIAQSGAQGAGAILQLAPGQNSFVTLATFNQGITPIGQLAIDATGNLYGTTSFGGVNNQGSIFELTADHSSFITIASFDYTNYAPQGDLISDAQGDLFGTSYNGGPGNVFISNVFELPAGSSTLTNVANMLTFDGSHFQPGLRRDSAGNIFGAIYDPAGASSIFEIPATSTGVGRLTTIASVPQFSNAGLNANNADGYIGLDSSGNLYGTTTASATGNQDTIFKIAGAASPQLANHLIVVRQPGKTIISTTIAPPIQVALLDSNGSLVRGANAAVTVRISSGPAGANLSGTTTVNAINGVASFTDLAIDKVGTYTLTFSSSTITAAATQAFRIAPSPLDGSHLVFARQPIGATAGKKLDPFVVTAELPDNVISTHTRGKVTLSVISRAGAILYGRPTARLRKGVATFKNVKFKTAGIYILQASTEASIPVNSDTFIVSPAPAKKMLFQQQPSKVVGINQMFNLSVELIDKYGNLVTTGDESSVSLMLGMGKKRTELMGALTAPVSGGVAVFDGLSISRNGRYNIIAADAADRLKIRTKAFSVKEV